MSIKKSVIAGGLLLINTSFISNVSAFTLNSDLGPLDIDFRSTDWQPAHGQSSYSTGNEI